MIRRLLHTSLALALACAAAGAAAQAWPAKPIRMIVPYTPGGYTDNMARGVGEPLARALGTTVIFENRPGANSILGAEMLAKSAPDGYTLGTVIAAHSANATLYPKLPFDVQKDFAPVALISVAPLILVANNDFPAKSVAEFIAYAKANPGRINFGSSGNGAAAHLTMEYLKGLTGTSMQHVPYKGTAPALTDLIGGAIGVMFDVPATMMPHVRAGKIRALGVTSDKRVGGAPEVPTFNESGMPGFLASSWAMVLAPAGTPADIVNRLATEITRVVRGQAFRDRFESQGIIPAGGTPEEAAAFLRTEVAKWGKVIRDANVKVD
ncbi:MAG: tripartite tricarboxylate transporter substrate binding protein [Burkholderiales bacterium]|nr:tripartite tricarboxylate transporter substrate binding protein [Burkholderiales bacterium]